MSRPHPLHGLLAEFASAEALVDAAVAMRQAGYRHHEVYSPRPLDGLPPESGLRRWLIPLLAVGGALSGIAGGFFLQYYASVISYPVNVGGRPFNSWPAFIPISIESGLLGAAAGIMIGFLLLAKLPRLHHPLFSIPAFERVTRDGFFLCATAADPHFDSDRTRTFLEGLDPLYVLEVER